ncbi:cobalt ABC transporter permease [Chachezhania sediminis]|uniref:cobalt ABC transporter permease n=1 Tax=Chachezhania sediminis TaxID=2599291 RepID=UPI00131E5264|nr:cobalt ABC transporter permease [Chachezhania sediminis]
MIRLLALSVALLASPAAAHDVIAELFPAGHAIEGEIGFSNGEFSKNQRVEVLDDTGAPLGETVTDDTGLFRFVPEKPVTHVFRADLGSGHVALVEMPAEEVAQILSAPTASGGATPAPVKVADKVAPAVAAPTEVVVPVALSAEVQAQIADLVRNELRPLRREMSDLKRAKDIQSILGGMGYVLGLFGLWFFLAARRKLAGAP